MQFSKTFNNKEAVSIKYVYKFPAVVPSGKYTGRILMSGSESTLFVCYDFDMVFSDPNGKKR